MIRSPTHFGGVSFGLSSPFFTHLSRVTIGHPVVASSVTRSAVSDPAEVRRQRSAGRQRRVALLTHPPSQAAPQLFDRAHLRRANICLMLFISAGLVGAMLADSTRRSVERRTHHSCAAQCRAALPMTLRNRRTDAAFMTRGHGQI